MDSYINLYFLFDQPIWMLVVEASCVMIAVLCCSIIITNWESFVSNKLQSNEINVKGPIRLPLFGNCFQVLLNYNNRLEYIKSLMSQYGDVFRFDVLGDRMYILSDPQALQYILKDNFDNYVKGEEFQRRATDLLGSGIFNSDGHGWKVQRKTASHMFSVRNMRDHMSGVFISHGHQFIHTLSKKTKEEEYFDIQDLFYRFTLDSIGEIAYGFDIGSLKGDVPFSKAFDQANRVTEFRFMNPLFEYCKWLLPSEYEMKKSMKVLNEFAESVVQDRKKALAVGDVKSQDVLTKFLLMKDSNGNAYDDNYLRDVILNFIIAGRDTTANLMSWCIYMFCEHPEIQEKAREEVDRVLEGGVPDYDKVNKLTYLYCFVNETLRFYPSVPLEIKFAVNDDVLPSGHRIHKGQVVAFSPYCMNRNEKYWKDAMVFSPERWLNGKPTAFQFPTFNAGPRTCLGQNMAYLESQTLLAMILQNFSISLKPNQTVTYQPTLTLPVKDGLFVHLTRRK